MLDARLVECVQAILEHADRCAVDILGDVDEMKFRSYLTLFAQVAPEQPVFDAAL